MSVFPRDSSCVLPTPPGSADNNSVSKTVQVKELLQQVLNKYQNDPEYIDKCPNETELLVVTLQIALLPTANVKQDFLQKILSTGKDLLLNEQIHIEENKCSTVDSNLPKSDQKDVPIPITFISSMTTSNDNEGEFSLGDLAEEYLQDAPSPISNDENRLTPSESSGSDLTPDSNCKEVLSSPPSNSSLSNNSVPLLFDEPMLVKSPLESILFSKHLLSHDAAADADEIWKHQLSPFGEMFCKTSCESPTQVTKRISTCLLDRTLYERLTHLITLLPKKCAITNVQQISIGRSGPRESCHTPQSMTPRSNRGNGRSMHRPTFQQNVSYSNSASHYSTVPTSRPYLNSIHTNQQANPGGVFIDRRQPQQHQHQQQQHQHQQQQQQYRHQSSQNHLTAQTASGSYSNDYQPQQQRYGHKNNSRGNGGRQTDQNRQQRYGQHPSNDNQHSRGTRNNFSNRGGSSYK